MPCSTRWQRSQVKEIDRALNLLRSKGILPSSPGVLNLQSTLGSVRLNLGFKIPRPISFIFMLFGLSPGVITVWHDAESGFFSEARARPGAPPVYKHISDDVAITLMKREVTPELELELMEPDVDIDN